MKAKFLAIAALAATTLSASCGKGDVNKTEAETIRFTVRISGVNSNSRAVEAPGASTEGTVELENGHIFVIDPLGAVIESAALNVGEATNGGQLFPESVPSDSRVYIIGNIPGDDKTRITGLGSFAAIRAAVSQMTTQTDYKKAALANSNGQPEAIVPGAEATATVAVSIKPLISRMELVQVRGGANKEGDAITAFTVTGVYVDSYFPGFTYIGGGSGDEFGQGTDTAFTGIGDGGAWPASGDPLAASPKLNEGSKELWAYNVASGGLPRFIIRLEGVKYQPVDGAEVDLSDRTHYLTVTKYNGVTEFKRGMIYRIGADNGIAFTPDDLGLTPNPENVSLTVNVSIVEWEIATPDAEL